MTPIAEALAAVQALAEIKRFARREGLRRQALPSALMPTRRATPVAPPTRMERGAAESALCGKARALCG